MIAKHSITVMMAAVLLLASSLPVPAFRMDDRIEATARKSYVFKTYLQGDDIKIESRDGAVTLTGVVSEESHKLLAHETLAGLPGVRSVDNRLELKDAPPSANSDAWLLDKVKATLFFHRRVSSGITAIEVREGVVTLRGTAANQAQKDLTTEYVRDVAGVRGVTNEMAVNRLSKRARTAGEKIDDASITAQAKMTLLYRRSTSSLDTTIKTRRGVVTVSGTARNAAEKDLVTRILADIAGVKGVSNRMTID